MLIAIAAIGILVGSLDSTGLGLKLANVIGEIRGESLFSALLVAMVGALVLGMGMPTLPAYLIIILVMGPAIQALGVSMLTARDLNDTSSDRIAAFLPRFKEVVPPDPENANWEAWEALMAADRSEDPALPEASMAIAAEAGYGTVSGSLIALPRDMPEIRPIWRFCGGRPGTIPYGEINL